MKNESISDNNLYQRLVILKTMCISDESMFRPVFGCPLEDHLRVNDREIAFVIEECVLYILDQALEVEVHILSLFASHITCCCILQRVVFLIIN